MVGLDGTGKTRILQRISNEITRSEPISGFVVESCKFQNLFIHSWNIANSNKSEWNTLLDLVYESTDGIIFVIDSADRIRMDNSEGFFWDTVRRHFDMLLEKDYVRNAALLILANKQDLTSAMDINTMNNKLELNSLRNRQYFITSCNATKENNDENGINVAFEWLLYTLNENKYCIQSELKSILLISGYIRETDAKYKLLSFIPIEIVKFIHLLYKNQDYDYNEYKYYGELNNEQNEESQKTILLMQFINRKYCENYIENDEQFIKIYKLKLNESETKWNHYNFMRMIWIFFTMFDRRKGLKQIWKYTPYNVTKTYFWSQLIYFGMFKQAQCRDFEYFLIINPSFSNDYNCLMKKYYSNKLLNKMDDENCKNEMILPDLMPLPSLITNIKNVKVTVKTGKYKRFKQCDEIFLKEFENKTFKSWEGHTSFLRVIWCYINTLKAQFTSIIQRKWMHFDKYNYNCTKTYFWIHIMRYYMTLYKNVLLLQQKQKNEDNNNEWSFEAFLHFCSSKYQCKIEYSEWYKDFYSDHLLQNAPNNKLVFPDIKQLPNM